MSREYEMKFTIEDFDPKKELEIQSALEEVWNIDHFYKEEASGKAQLKAYGECSLSGGEDEEEFIARVYKALVKVNGGNLRLGVEATYLEVTPPSMCHSIGTDGKPEDDTSWLDPCTGW